MTTTTGLSTAGQTVPDSWRWGREGTVADGRAACRRNDQRICHRWPQGPLIHLAVEFLAEHVMLTVSGFCQKLVINLYYGIATFAESIRIIKHFHWPGLRILSLCMINAEPFWFTRIMKKAFRETQTLRAGCSKAEPKKFALPQTPSRGRRTAKI